MTHRYSEYTSLSISKLKQMAELWSAVLWQAKETVHRYSLRSYVSYAEISIGWKVEMAKFYEIYQKLQIAWYKVKKS